MTTTLPAGWKPIESAPKDGSRVLIWHPDYCAPITAQWYGNEGWKMDSDVSPFWRQPTHWVPLPAAPCLTCGGHGMVGGLTPHSGYDAEPCPDCTPPASTQDAPITVSLDPDPRGVSVGVWQGSHCIYNGAHAVPVSAQDDAKDDETQAILRWIMCAAESAKEDCGMDSETPASIRNGKLASIASAAAQALGLKGGPSYSAPAAGDARKQILDLEAAAKTLAECMDYPWAHMPEQGRAHMRQTAQSVTLAALSASQQQEG